MKSYDKTFGVLGGDKRSYYLAKALKNDGYKVRLWGFDKLGATDCEVASALDSDILILPVMPFGEGENIVSPYSDQNLNLKEYEDSLMDKLLSLIHI